MTSQQILQSELLDILFDGRNKLYGAYQLRKMYPLELLKAIGSTITATALLILFLQPDTTKKVNIEDAGKVVVVDHFVLPKKEKKNIPPVIPDRPKANTPKQQAFIANFTITDKEVVPVLPTQDMLENAAIADRTSAGTDAQVFQPPVTPGKESSPGNSNSTQTEEPVGIKPDKQPQFPGGTEAWIAFLTRHLQAPEILESGEKRMVLIRFHVSEDGSIANFSVVQSAGREFDDEVIRVLKKMPKWSPALQAGQPVAVSFTQPVTFVRMEE